VEEPSQQPEYVFEEKPETGQVLDIAPGLRWLRLPLPFQLAHINVWLLEEAGGYAIVDTGLDNKTTRAVWDKVFQRDLHGKPAARVVVTHLHPDHSGCAGWLCRQFGCELWMTRDEYRLHRLLAEEGGHPEAAAGRSFYRAAGLPEAALENYIEHYRLFSRVVSSLPDEYRRISDGDTVAIGHYDWTVIAGSGHSPEHASLYCAKLNALIAGDQLLPTISSNISVYPNDPSADPLAQWFDSLDRLERKVPEDVLVLPAHGKPFKGAHRRIAQLREEHRTGLRKLLKLCREPHRAVDVFPALFKSRITDQNLIMAIGESLSHLNYLLLRGELQVEQDNDGVNWYRIGQ
jgi:glyoxylase-like metal-dependent hydrolase (beta-lactamase superfamily II)